MRWARVISPAVVPYACLAMLFTGLVIDLNSDQALVVAIIYNIPIAISAALASRTLTSWVIGLALAANTAAGYVNAVAVGSVDAFTVANRGLAGLSFLIVGAMTLLFELRSHDVAELSDAEDDAERQQALRRMTVALSRPLGPDELLAAASEELQILLEADAVVIVGLDGERFAEPRWSAPEFTSVAETGKLASWAVDALPMTSTPVITARSDRGITSVGRLSRPGAADLVIVADRPRRRLASALLGEAITALVALLERATELERLRQVAEGRDVTAEPLA